MKRAIVSSLLLENFPPHQVSAGHQKRRQNKPLEQSHVLNRTAFDHKIFAAGRKGSCPQISSFLRTGFSAAGLLILAACASTSPSSPSSSSSAGASPSAASSSSAVPARAFKKAEIMDKDAASLDRLLGAPALSRKEGAGEFRRYALKDCNLIVVLYPGKDGRARVRHMDAAAPASDAKTPSLEACLASGGR